MGLALVAQLRAEGRALPRDLTVLGIRAEEMCWFPVNYIGSRAAFGLLPPHVPDTARRSDSGKTLAEHMVEEGFDPQFIRDGRASLDPARIHAFIEPHIEQGPVLENEGYDLGIVTGGFATERALVTVTGETSHAGTTPMEMRRDAVLAAAEMISAGEAVLYRIAPEARMTVCRFLVDPGADGVVPGQVRFAFEYRHPSNEVLAQLLAEADAAMAAIAANKDIAKDQAEVLATALGKAKIEIVGGEGAHLIDEDGARWLDMVNNVCHVGHCH
eukprot:gene51151-62550_t